MATVDPEELARAIRQVSERIGLRLPATATRALRFPQFIDLGDGSRGVEVVESPAVRVGDRVAIRVEGDSYRVYNLAASPYHGLFHLGFCKTKDAGDAIRVAVMAAIHEHYTALFLEEFRWPPDDDR